MSDPNTSATGGYLEPKPLPSPVPAADGDLADVLQPVFAAITGLDTDTGVRLSWQREPPPLPAPDVSWMAFGVSDIRPDDEAAVTLNADGAAATLRRDEQVEVLCSFFGPGAQAYAGRLRDGLEVEQNRAGLYAASIAYVASSEPLRVPDKRNGQWVDRWDFKLTLTREVRRGYRVLSVLGGGGVVVNDQGDSPVAFGVTPEP